MSTGQTRTYPFWQKEKTARCLPILFVILQFCILSMVSTPDRPPLILSFVLYPLGLRRRLSDGKTAIRY